MNSLRIAFLVFPDVLQLDFTGPYGILAAGPNVTIDLVWKDTLPVRSSDGLILTPTASIYDDTTWDVLCVPGGAGILPLLSDKDVLQFLQHQAHTAQYVTSVCTGALILGAAGLLRGYAATTHWQAIDMLAPFGATPIPFRRVTIDRNRITAAGVSAGIDMGLTLAGLLWGIETAQSIQLSMEYSPEPPYEAGSPRTAPASVVTALQKDTAQRRQDRLTAVKKAAAQLAVLADIQKQ